MGTELVFCFCCPACPLPQAGMQQESCLSPSDREADVFLCPNLTARCVAEFERHHPILEILTAVACSLYPAQFPCSIFVILCG